MNRDLSWQIAIESMDECLRLWAEKRGAAEHRWPVLIESSTLERAGYLESFPHLLMTAGIPGHGSGANDALSATPWCLSPAVCYHAYVALSGRVLTDGVRISASGLCFRNEEKSRLAPGERQVEFRMRELILVGSPGWLAEELAGVEEEISAMAAGFNLCGEWQPACDPFFLPAAAGKEKMQRLLKTKREFCLPNGLAIASINRHRTFFGERFSIGLPDGRSASSACVAFGLDRWAYRSSSNSHICVP